MQTNDEQQSWQEAVATLVANAMQIAIMAWEDKTLKKLSSKERVAAMKELSDEYATAIIAIAEARSFGAKNMP